MHPSTHLFVYFGLFICPVDVSDIPKLIRTFCCREAELLNKQINI